MRHERRQLGSIDVESTAVAAVFTSDYGRGTEGREGRDLGEIEFAGHGRKAGRGDSAVAQRRRRLTRGRCGRDCLGRGWHEEGVRGEEV